MRRELRNATTLSLPQDMTTYGVEVKFKDPFVNLPYTTSPALRGKKPVKVKMSSLTGRGVCLNIDHLTCLVEVITLVTFPIIS
jgi:hypothetical protein